LELLNKATYQVRAQARCATDTSVVSSWSGAKTVTIQTQPSDHAVSTPDTPSGPSSGEVGELLNFSTGGSTCNQGHSVQYRFDWGNGNYSNWSSSTSSSYSYSTAGTPPVTRIDSIDINESEGTATFTWSGSDDTTPAAELVYTHRLLNLDSPVYDWSDWSYSTTATYPRPPDPALPNGTYRFQIKAKDADNAIQSDLVEWEFTIGAGDKGSMSVKVVDALTRQEISGATILLDPDPFTWCYDTDSSGQASFPIPAGMYHVTAAREGYERETKTNVTIGSGDSVDLYFSLQLTSIDWVTTNRDDVCIYEYALGVPNSSLKEKELPAGWVLRRLTESGSPIEDSPDGIRWFHLVEDVTDGTFGWVERGNLNDGGENTRVKVLLLKDEHLGGFTFKEDLQQGMSNAREDIRLLQAVLNEEGSALEIDGYFGPITQDAVKRFQELYSQEILAPLGLSQGTGYVGSSTRAKLNQLLEEDLSFKARYELEKGRAQVIRQEVEEHKSEFELGNFPTDIIFAMAAQETGNDDFNNEILAPTPCGRGIMQIDRPDSNVGAGSGITCYNENNEVDYCGNYEKCCESGGNCTIDCKCYYTNTIQGIEANLKDGLYVLNKKYQASKCTNSSLQELLDNVETCPLKTCDEYRVVDSVWRYNGRIVSVKPCQGHRYPGCVANRCSVLGDYFSDPGTALAEKWVPRLRFVSSSPYKMIAIKSPANIKVYDSLNRLTGALNGVITEEIPFSSYEREYNAVIIPFSYDSYRYQVTGTASGTYGLTITYAHEEDERVFQANKIPIARGSIHQYTIDWDALARDEEGVTLEIDNDGDGTYEQTITSDSELTGAESNGLPSGEALCNGPNPVSDSGTAFFYTLPSSATSAKIILFDISGRPLFETSIDPASTRFPTIGTWNPVDSRGVELANGPYIYVLIVDGKAIGQGKMVIQR